jgi:cardiolipin synthase
MSEPHFQFYTTPEYYADLIKRLAGAKPGERVIVVTMSFHFSHPDVRPLHTALCAAARRGVKVSLIVDAFGFIAAGPFQPGPLFFHANMPRRLHQPFQDDLDTLEELKAAGGRYAIINQPGRPFTSHIMGRSHLKFSVIGDRYYIGSANLSSYERLDMMVAADDAGVANWLAGLSERFISAGSVLAALPEGDISRSVGDNTTFYVDAGGRGRSLILEQALEFIDSAQEHVLITSQYFPGAITATHLLAAHERGVRVRIIYNHAGRHRWPSNWLHAFVNQAERLRLPAEFFAHPYTSAGYLHAKLIATEQGAMMGSHNFIQAGVTFGTAEIAMRVRDPEFSRRAVAAITGQLPARLSQ